MSVDPQEHKESKNYNLQELGIRSFKLFVAAIYHLEVEEKKQFDLVIATGNSGMTLAAIMGIMHSQLRLPSIPTILIPIQRYDPTIDHWVAEENNKFFDNTVLISQIKKDLEKIGKLKSLLFIDDEIFRGTTAKVALDLVTKAVDPRSVPDEINYTIVAEDQGFEGLNIPGVKLEFYPSGEEIDDLNNVIGYSTPKELVDPIREHFDETQITRKNVMNILLNLPNKEIVDGIPEFTKSKNALVESKVTDLNDLQNKYLEQIKTWIKEAIDEYKAGSLSLFPQKFN